MEKLVFGVGEYRALAAADREVYLFRWLTQLEQCLESNLATPDALKGRQEQLEQVLLEIAGIPSSTQARSQSKRTWLRAGPAETPAASSLLGSVPRATRVVRNLVAHCLVLVYERGQMHQMGDTLYAIQSSMQQTKYANARESAMVCAGVLFARLGNRAGFRLLSCFNDFVGIAVKALNGSQDGLKLEAARMLARLVAGSGGKVMNEQQAREIARAARTNLATRGAAVVVATAGVVEALSRVSTKWDVDSMVTQLLGLLNTRVVAVRRALARALAVVLASNLALTEEPAMRADAEDTKSVRMSTTGVRRDTVSIVARSSGDLPGSDSAAPAPAVQTAASSPRIPAADIAGPAWTLARVLQRLSTAFARAARDQRTGIADAYAMLFDELSTAVVAAKYTEIAGHVLGLTAVASSVAEQRAVRSTCVQLLGAAHSVLDTEASASAAANVLYTQYICGEGISADAAVVALRGWQQLGVFDTEHVVPAERWLIHTRAGVRLAAAAALGALARKDVARMPQLLGALVPKLQRASAQCASGDINWAPACLGYAAAVSAILAVCHNNLMSVPLDSLDWVHAIATRLVYAAYGRSEPLIVGAMREAADPAQVMSTIGGNIQAPASTRPWHELPTETGLAQRSVQMHCGWMLLAGVASLGDWRASWPELWAIALPVDGAAFVTGDMSWAERAHVLQARTLALAHIHACLVRNSTRVNVAQLTGMMRATLLFADNALDAPGPVDARERAARAVRELAVPVSMIDLHLRMRAGVLECLALADAHAVAQTSAVQPVLRLAERAIAGNDSLAEQFTEQLCAAAAEVGPAGASPVAKNNELNSSSMWTYEVDAGITSLAAESDSGAIHAVEHDWLHTVMNGAWGVAPTTRMVDASVRVVGHAFAYVGETAQAALLDTLVTRLNLLPFNGHRHMAVLTNIITAVHAAVHECSAGALAMAVARAAVETARAALLVPDPRVRALAGSVMGRLAAVTRDATAYVPFVLGELSRLAIRSRDRFARAGAAVALGALYAQAGALAAGSSSLRQVVAMLHSLASDRDPIVHASALEALAEAAASAGYMFEPYARTTCQMAQKLMLSDAHTQPFFASALWARSREPAGADRTFVRAAHGRVAVGRECAVVHPDSSAYHGRAPDEAVREHTDAAFAFVCAARDSDSVDSRASLGKLVGALLLVLGPELQVDEDTRSRRALPSVVAGAWGLAVDSDARADMVSELIIATQRRLLFSAAVDRLMVPQFVRNVLQPCLRLRRCVYHGFADSLALCRLHHVAARALESMLRLYSDSFSDAGDEWSVCAVIWEALWLHSDTLDSDVGKDTQRLVCTLTSSACSTGSWDEPTLAVVEALCTVFSKHASRALPDLQFAKRTDGAADVESAQPLGVKTRQLAIAAMLAILDEIDRQPQRTSGRWRAHPLLVLLPDMLRAAHTATVATDNHDMCVLGLRLVQRIVEQFADVEDPAMAGQRVLLVYQAQLTSAFMPRLHLDSAVAVRVAAIHAAAAYVVSGLVADRDSLVRVLRLLAPQPDFDALPFANGSRTRARSQSVASATDLLETGTPQLHVVVRLALLGAWADIFGYAQQRRSLMADLLDMHLPLLAQMWMGAIRDAAVICNYYQNPASGRDVLFGQLDVLRGDHSYDVGLGLVLGLEATYVPMVQQTLAAWYLYYVPRIFLAVSRLLAADSPALLEYLQRDELAQLPGIASDKQPSRMAVLVLGFVVQELARVTAAVSDAQVLDDPLVRTLRERLIAALDTGDGTESAKKDSGYIGVLIDALSALLSIDAHHLESAFIATECSSQPRHSWLVAGLWTQAVSMPLRDMAAFGFDVAEKALNFAIRLLDKLGAADIDGTTLLDCWLFTGADAEHGDNVEQWLQQQLTPLGQTVVRDAVAVWQIANSELNHGQAAAVVVVARALDVLARILGCCQSELCVSLWVSLWTQSLARYSRCASQAAESLAAFVQSELQSNGWADSDMLSGAVDSGNARRAVGAANAVLLQMLESDEEDCRVTAVLVAAQLLARPELQFAVSGSVRTAFVAEYAACVPRMTAIPDSDQRMLLTVPAQLAQTNSASAVLIQLARESIPELAKLAYAQTDNDQLLERVLSALVRFSAVAKHHNGEMVMAATLMLLLSMVDTQCSQPQVAEAILSLATIAPDTFKAIVVRLSGNHPEAKAQYQIARRPRASF
ncbi:hypothetical protein IWW55_000152 [Coemansia sp. RSA 2706]|nr:hypothetical protein IWW55_000152 [Coemansia sp. RSA 2706]